MFTRDAQVQELLRLSLPRRESEPGRVAVEVFLLVRLAGRHAAMCAAYRLNGRPSQLAVQF